MNVYESDWMCEADVRAAECAFEGGGAAAVAEDTRHGGGDFSPQPLCGRGDLTDPPDLNCALGGAGLYTSAKLLESGCSGHVPKPHAACGHPHVLLGPHGFELFGCADCLVNCCPAFAVHNAHHAGSSMHGGSDA